MPFAEKLKALRQQAGLTQKQLAEQIGLYRESVARLENGEREPGWGTIQAICRALAAAGVKVDCTAFAEEPAPEVPAAPTRKRGKGK